MAKAWGGYGAYLRFIDELSVQLSNVEEERRKLDKMRQDFVSNISHELRTPVTVIKSSLEVLEEGLITDPDEMREYFHQMSADTTHLQLEKNALNLTDVMIEAIHSMQRISDQKQVEIQRDKEMGSLRFVGDYGRLRQMFMIILDNAVKFSPPNDVVLVKIVCKENNCIISISDHGNGILPEDILYIFDRFYKERSEQNKNGSGLGLSIAKQIADRHDIAIKYDSKPGSFTAFSFTFLLDCDDKH